MLDTVALGHGVTCIDTGYIRPRMTACYLMQHDGAAAFIDTGVNHNVAGLLQLLDRQGIARERLEYVMATHVHLDHAGGVGALMQALPAARLVIHPRGARHMIDPSKLAASAMAVYGEQKFHSMYGELLPVDKERVIIADDGYALDLRGRALQFIDTPGHARHHYCVIDEMSNGVFSGDTMGISYPELNTHRHFAFPTTTPVQFEPHALHDSVDKIMAYRPARLYLTHFGCVEQVDEQAEQMHRDIDALVDMLQQHQPTESELAALMSEYFYQRVARAGSQLAKRAVADILALDVELNAKGLTHWANTKRGREHVGGAAG